MNLRISSKTDAERLLTEYTEFSHHDFIEGEFWFRYDGPQTNTSHEYTINHETEGIVGASREEAIRYIYRNRRRINNADFSMVKATKRILNEHR